MKSESEVLNDLKERAREEKTRAVQLANNLYEDLVRLCILSSISENILSEEESHDWENRNYLINGYNSAISEIEFWNRRIELLDKHGISYFRSNYGVIRNQSGFVEGLRRPE